MKKIDPDGALGTLLTFMSVATLATLFLGGIVIIIYGAFKAGSVLMMAVLFLAAIVLPIAWLEYAQK
jgi:hypothetical protein